MKVSLNKKRLNKKRLRNKNILEKILSKGIILLLILIILVLSLIHLTGSVSFLNNPSINPTEPDTTHNLICSWNASTDTTQENVTWHNDGVSFKNETNPSESQSVISSDDTSRGETWNCTVTLSNATNTTTQIVNVTIKNAPPITPVMTNSSGQDVGNSTNVTEDQANVFNLSATDPDGDTVTYGYYDSLPNGASFNSNTGVFSWTPDYDNSDVNITFYAKDNQTPFANTNKFVMFTVQYVNDIPEFSPALTNQTINESEVFNYYIYGTDEENNTPFNFSINVTPSLDLIVNITSNTSAVIMFEGNRTATYAESGNYTINVTLYDNQSANTTSSFILTILQVNLPPVLELVPNQTGTQGLNVSFNVSANDPDVNDTLNFSIVPTVCSITNPWNISTINNSHNATGLVNISNLTNNHVICRYVKITVIDGAGAEDSQDVFLNVSNTNDPPNIEVLSSYSNHTDGNNITNLTAYAESPFVYLVNATDIDEDTYEGEVLSYSNNASFFTINSTTGLISFTPNQSQIGNHTILINVSDDQGFNDTQVMNLEIRNNSAPVLMSIGNLSCSEDNICSIIINASDADNDNLTFTSNNTAVFNLTDNLSQSPVINAYVNYTPNQSQIGNHSIVITVTDIRGATDNETILFTINNTNDDPVIQAFSFPSLIIETHTASLYVYADDQDYDLPGAYAITNISGSGYNLTEYVTFNDTNLTGKDLFNISTYLNTSNNKTYARIIFTPQLGDAGNYSVNITVTDYYNATDYVVKNFTVLNKTNPPNITRIMPYGRPVSSQTVFNFTNTSLFNGTTQTAINFSENQSILYNITVTDDTTAQENLSYAWYINASLNSTTSYLNISYDFFSSRRYNVTVIVSDDMYENSSFTWNVTVDDVNRAPRLLNPLNNISNVTATTSYTDYLKKTTDVHFIDPDDDLDDSSEIDGNETSNLTYNVTSCSVATITFSGHSVSVVPEEVGYCTVYFTASDAGGLSNTSNVVWVNVTDVPDPTQDPQPTSGGGGGITRSVVVPMRKEEEKPKAIEIVVPELVTVYKNKTVLIPITIRNNWNSSLIDVRINASTNASYVEFEFTEDYFEELSVGEKRNITLMVRNYRLGENYEVKITANVTNPEASDSALVLLSTIEQAEEGEDVETKVTFAQDLLSDNPECSELNELLLRAVEELESGSREEASRMVSGVIDGCKYLVSISRKAEQQPQSIITKFLIKENLKYFLIFLGLVGVIVITTMIIKRRKTKTTMVKEKEEKKPEEEEVKPYWP